MPSVGPVEGVCRRKNGSKMDAFGALNMVFWSNFGRRSARGCYGPACFGQIIRTAADQTSQPRTTQWTRDTSSGQLTAKVRGATQPVSVPAS
jgi:hypothetical protein